MRARPSLCIVVAVLATTVASGCTARREQHVDPITVRIALAVSPSATDLVNGARLAVDVVNEAVADLPLPLAAEHGLPGLSGATLNLTIVDTNNTAAVTKVSSVLSTLDPAGVIAAGAAATTAAVSAQTERLQVPLIDALSSADYLTDLGQEWYFRTAPSDHMLAEAAFSLLQHQQLAATPDVRLAVLHDGRADPLLALVRELAGTAGYPTVFEADATKADAFSLANDIEAADANVLVAVAGAASGATDATKVARLISPAAPLLGIGAGFTALGATSTAVGSPTVLRAVDWSAEYAGRNPVAAAVAALYQKRYGKPMTAGAAEVFTATLALAVAVNTAGAADSTAVRATLRHMWLPATQLLLPWNGIRFDATGQNTLAGAVMEARTPAGFRIVYPRELAAVPIPW